ncbi:unnamed protein product [Cunninghamella blakesleeana]
MAGSPKAAYLDARGVPIVFPSSSNPNNTNATTASQKRSRSHSRQTSGESPYHSPSNNKKRVRTPSRQLTSAMMDNEADEIQLYKSRAQSTTPKQDKSLLDEYDAYSESFHRSHINHINRMYFPGSPSIHSSPNSLQDASTELAPLSIKNSPILSPINHNNHNHNNTHNNSNNNHRTNISIRSLLNDNDDNSNNSNNNENSDHPISHINNSNNSNNQSNNNNNQAKNRLTPTLFPSSPHQRVEAVRQYRQRHPYISPTRPSTRNDRFNPNNFLANDIFRTDENSFSERYRKKFMDLSFQFTNNDSQEELASSSYSSTIIKPIPSNNVSPVNISSSQQHLYDKNINPDVNLISTQNATQSPPKIDFINNINNNTNDNVNNDNNNSDNNDNDNNNDNNNDINTVYNNSNDKNNIVDNNNNNKNDDDNNDDNNNINNNSSNNDDNNDDDNIDPSNNDPDINDNNIDNDDNNIVNSNNVNNTVNSDKLGKNNNDDGIDIKSGTLSKENTVIEVPINENDDVDLDLEKNIFNNDNAKVDKMEDSNDNKPICHTKKTTMLTVDENKKEEGEDNKDKNNNKSTEKNHKLESEKTDREKSEREKSERELVLKEINYLNNTIKHLSTNYKIIDKIGFGSFGTVYKAKDLQDSIGQYYKKLKVSQQKKASSQSSSSSPLAILSPLSINQDDDNQSINNDSQLQQQSINNNHHHNFEFVALKHIYSLSSPQRMGHEIKVLNELRGSTCIAPLISAFRQEDNIFMVMPYFEHDDFRDCYRNMTMLDIKYYLISLLTGLKHLHKKSIMHRDIKPGNFLYNMKLKTGMLIDFGLAQKEESSNLSKTAKTSFQSVVKENKQKPFKPFQSISIFSEYLNGVTPTKPGYFKNDYREPAKANRCGTRGFRAPEVLLRVRHQTVAIDIWSVGVILLSLLTGRYPFFVAQDEGDSLLEIASLFGLKDMKECAAIYNRTFETNIETIPKTRISLRKLCQVLNTEKFKLWTNDYKNDIMNALNLLEKLLTLDYTERITAEEALMHPFLTL